MFRNLVVLSRGRVLRSAAMIFAVVAGGLVVNTQSAAAAAYDGTDPAATGCANTARTIDARNLNGGNARIELRYSSACQTAWARVILQNGMRCVPGVTIAAAPRRSCATATAGATTATRRRGPTPPRDQPGRHRVLDAPRGCS